MGLGNIKGLHKIHSKINQNGSGYCFAVEKYLHEDVFDFEHPYGEDYRGWKSWYGECIKLLLELADKGCEGCVAGDTKVGFSTVGVYCEHFSRENTNLTNEIW